MSRPDHQHLKDTLVATGEQWDPTWDHILALDPDYLAAYTSLRRVPSTTRALPLKVQHLILLACDASCTHLHAPGVRSHTAAALAAGASRAEILETLELTSVLGIHAVTAGLPLLQEVLREEGKPSLANADAESENDLTDRQKQIKHDFIQNRGYWSASWPPILRLSPNFMEAYMRFSSVPFTANHGALDAKTKELVFCAIDCATTHLYLPGLKVHIRNAVKCGATEQEIMEVFQLASLMGVQTVKLGVDVLVGLEREEGKVRA